MSDSLGVAIPSSDQIADVDTWTTSQAASLDPGVPIVYLKVGRTVAPIGPVAFHVAE